MNSFLTNLSFYTLPGDKQKKREKERKREKRKEKGHFTFFQQDWVGGGKLGIKSSTVLGMKEREKKQQKELK